jgi:hypothetical protein
MSGSAIFSALVSGAIKLSYLVLILSVCVASVLASYQTYLLFQWQRGSANCCHKCGGITTQKHGRYGSYLKCLACGKNKSN